MSPGQKIKSLLNLDNFNNAYIQRAINTSVPLFVVSIDSKYYDRFISVTRMKKTNTTRVYTFKTGEVKDLRLTPPIILDDFYGQIPGNSIFVRRDLAGDYFIRDSLFESGGNQAREIEIVVG